MKKHLIILASVMAFNSIQAQQPLTPEKLWELHRVNGIGITPDQQYVLVSVSTPNVKENNFFTGLTHVNLSGVGCPELGVIIAMPTTGKLEGNT